MGAHLRRSSGLANDGLGLAQPRTAFIFLADVREHVVRTGSNFGCLLALVLAHEVGVAPIPRDTIESASRQSTGGYVHLSQTPQQMMSLSAAVYALVCKDRAGCLANQA